jgi:hypothetical protein
MSLMKRLIKDKKDLKNGKISDRGLKKQRLKERETQRDRR